MTQDELLQLMDQAAREGWRELDLHNQGITELPAEISQITYLSRLDLSNNQLKTLPQTLDKLQHLTYLDLSGNEFLDLDSFPTMKSMGEYVLDWQQIERMFAEEADLQFVQPMMGGDSAVIVPAAVKQLDPVILYWRDDQAAMVPLLIDLSQKKLTTLPAEIGQLRSLQFLDLNDNQLTAVPPEIGQLRSLRWLHLRHNQLTAVPPEIGQLHSLQELDLFSNQLTAVPAEIGQLSSLQVLDLTDNQLTAVPPEIGQLPSLQGLHLSGNQLTAVPAEIGQLHRLQQLDLRVNQLTAVPPEIGHLRRLQWLALSDNQLTAVPPEIGHLHSLQWLYLGDNQLTAVPAEIGQLSRLQELDLRGNQLTILPGALRLLKALTRLHLYDNPLPLLPELLGRSFNPGDPQVILDTYFQASRPLHEAKLLLVGEGDVGKSSLVDRLVYKCPPSNRGKTIGLDIHPWHLPMPNDEGQRAAASDGLPLTANRLRINVWDFGGQEIYHATHQFFLTHRSLYLVVIEARKDEAANRLDYWLRHVQSFAGEAPIILVVNKSEDGRLALDERGLMLKHQAIKAIVHTSCTTGEGIPALRQAIEQAVANLPHLNDWIPVTWYTVKDKLTDLAKAKDYLSYETYIDRCLAEGIKHEAAQRTLARFLHDLGAVLNFQDDRRLAGTHVLNPEWVTSGIYAIMNAPALQENGLLRLGDLDAILDHGRYPLEKHPFLLDIMRRFELGVPLGDGVRDGERYLIPGLLPKERPAFDWPATAPVMLEYRYAILPAAILSRLMVRLHSHTWQNKRWRNGIALIQGDCRALVVADATAGYVTVALDGPAPHRRRLLSIIRAELDEIHTSFARLEAEEWVPMPGHPGKAIKYRALLNLEKRGQAAYYDADNDLEVDVYALLDGIESPDERAARPLQRQLVEYFNKEELYRLCFELGVDHEMWPDEGKPALARNLVLYFLRQGWLALLQEKLWEDRPFLR